VTIQSLSSVISGKNRRAGLGAAKLYSKSIAQTHYIHHLAIMAEQQVNLTDLDLNQLQDVKKQLDSVSSGFPLLEELTHE
jgi:hypothetical protein